MCEEHFYPTAKDLTFARYLMNYCKCLEEHNSNDCKIFLGFDSKNRKIYYNSIFSTEYCGAMTLFACLSLDVITAYDALKGVGFWPLWTVNHLKIRSWWCFYERVNSLQNESTRSDYKRQLSKARYIHNV